MKKLLLLFCFGIGMGSFLMGMDNTLHYSYQWLPVGNPIKVQDKNHTIQTYRFESPIYQANQIAGKFFINGEAAGTYEIIHEVKDGNAYLYTANYYPDNSGTFYHWHLKQKDETLFIMIEGEYTFPSRSKRLEPFHQHIQSLKEKVKKAKKWDNHLCPTDQEIISQAIQSDWGLWLTKTTPGKCISGIAGLLALYGTGRILWDTKAYCKKGVHSLFKLLKKRKQRKKHNHPAQEVS